jgi:catalase
VQAGNLYRLMSQDEKDRLITNLANAKGPTRKAGMERRRVSGAFLCATVVPSAHATNREFQ